MKLPLIFILLLLLPFATAIDYLPNNILNPTGAPLNTAIVPSNDPVWNYESIGLYEAHFKSDSTSGQIVRFESGGAYITLQPMALNWRNDLNQLQQISMIQNVAGTPTGNTMSYLGAYGATTHLEYIATDTQLKEQFIIENPLPDPAQYIIDGGNAALETNFIFSTNAFTITINGEPWDKTTTKTTNQTVTIKDAAGKTLYTLPPPIAIDAFGDTITGTYSFKKSGTSLYISHRTPKAWLDTAAYPVIIDPTFIVDYTPIPGELLTGASATSINKQSFDIQNITDVVSDDNDATNITLYRYDKNYTTITAVHNSVDYTTQVRLDDNVFTPELNIDGIGRKITISTTTNSFKNGMTFIINAKITDTDSQKIYYLTDSSGATTYGSFSLVGVPINTEVQRTTTLANTGAGVTTMYLSDLTVPGAAKIFIDYINVVDYNNASLFTGHWSQTYDNISLWFLKVRKLTPGTTNSVTYAYHDIDNITLSVNTTHLLNGVGWHYIPVDTLLDYEKNTIGMNSTNLRFFTDEKVVFSEFRLTKETNDTDAPNITGCTVDYTNISCNETAQFHCTITDLVGVENVTFTINGTPYEATQYFDEWYVDLSPTGYGTASFTLELVNATDLFGQSTTTMPNLTTTYNCTAPHVVNTTMTCLYNPYPGLAQEQQFVCSITDAENKTYHCYGITKSPFDGSIYDIVPRQELIDEYGASQAIEPTPRLAYDQVVKIDFSTKRLKHNQSVTYQALCINNENATDQLSYTIDLSPSIKEPLKILDATISTKSNATYLLLGAFALLFLGGLIIWFVKELRGVRR